MEFTTIKGFKDILPEEIETWQQTEITAREIFRSFGFMEIKPPLIERTELFSRSIGQDTDIVSKEMYSFNDSKGRGLTLRPEATASLVRAYIEHRLYQQNPIQKLYTIGPMFRHERPQKGRFRQFHQIDAEILGDPGPRSDAELIIMAQVLMEAVGVKDLRLVLNSLGCPTCRNSFKEELRTYLAKITAELCPDCQIRAESNPLRVFDCKVEACAELVSDAPSILGFICENCQKHFDSLQDYLRRAGLPFIINHRLVRGLDYYTRTAFEIQTDRLGAQNAVIGGGRYDGLIKQLGGPDHPAIGFAIGMERLVALIEKDRKPVPRVPDLFIIALGDQAEERAFHWLIELRRAGFWVEMEYTTKGLKAQMKKADRVGAKKTLIVGHSELDSGKGILRDMLTKDQSEAPLQDLVDDLKKRL